MSVRRALPPDAGGIIAGSARSERRLINGFAAAVIVGCLAGLIWLGQSDQWGKAKPSGGPRLSPVERIDGALISLGTGLLGARIAFVLTHWGYYSNHAWESAWLWQGGLSWVGGAIGATVGLAAYAGARRKPFLALTDGLAVPLALFSIGGWVGCLIDGCAYGRRASLGWLTPTSPDLLGNLAPRWPTQTAGALLGVALLVVLLTLNRRNVHPGMLGCLAVAVVAGGCLALEFVRADPVPVVMGVRLGALGAGAFLAASVIGLVLLGRHSNQEAG
jgi:phosphatidylglycerol:prolipoprotein diacylglycerol transferase